MSTPAPPPRLPGDLIVRLVEAHQRGNLHLPICHVDDVKPLLHSSDDREFAAAKALIDGGRVFDPEGRLSS